jgi:hypothetical protein
MAHGLWLLQPSLELQPIHEAAIGHRLLAIGQTIKQSTIQQI